jgi:hypothetical protein
LYEISSASLGVLDGVLLHTVKTYLEEEKRLELEPDFARTSKGLENGTQI